MRYLEIKIQVPAFFFFYNVKDTFFDILNVAAHCVCGFVRQSQLECVQYCFMLFQSLVDFICQCIAQCKVKRRLISENFDKFSIYFIL